MRLKNENDKSLLKAHSDKTTDLKRTIFMCLWATNGCWTMELSSDIIMAQKHIRKIDGIGWSHNVVPLEEVCHYTHESIAKLIINRVTHKKNF